MKKLIALLIVLMAGGGGGWWWWRQRAVQAEAAEAPPPVAKVERGGISLRVAATGRVVSNQDVDIKCKASGEIIQLPFDVSDGVKKDALLVEVDPVYAQRSIDQAKVTLDSAQAKLDKARQSLAVDEQDLVTERQRAEAAVRSAEAQFSYAKLKAKRQREMAEQEAGSVEEADLADTSAVQAGANLDTAKVRLEELKTMAAALELKRQDVKLAEAEVAADRIRLADAQQQLLDTKVAAPMDGVVTVRNVQKGQIIASGISNVGGGTTVLTLSDLSRIFVLASVDESDIGSLAVGQPASITADAFPRKRFRGKVERIAMRGVNVSNVVTFEVKIEVLGENKSLLRPEMTTNVEIVTAEREDTLLVPAEAVSRQRGKHSVQVRKADGSQEERAVETGIADDTRQEILSGLQEGEEVVLNKSAGESRWKKGEASSDMGQRAMMRGLGGFGGGGRSGGGGRR